MGPYILNDKNSFTDIENWLKEAKEKSNFDIKIILVGNKCDLKNERKVSKDEGEKFKEDNNLNMFFEASAKTGLNAKEIFVEAAKLLYKENLNSKNKKIIKKI